MSITRFEARLQSLRSKFNNYNVFKIKSKTEQVSQQQEPVVKKPTIRERVKTNLKQIASDYKDVGVDTWKNMKKYPIKTAFYLGTGGVVLTMYKTNPTEYNYKSRLVDSVIDMMLVGGEIRNKKSEYYMDQILKLNNLNLLEHKSFILFSIIKHNNFHTDCDLYEKQCKQLNKPNRWNIFNYFNLWLFNFSSIVDVGVFNYWIFLNKNLKDYDVNDQEFKNEFVINTYK